jgi:hypothetical protein
MLNEDHFKAALKMIRVTPGNYKSLTPDMILHLCKVVAEAEQKLREQPSVYDGKSEEQIKERTSF